MLDLAALTRIDKDAIRRNLWTRATAIAASARRPRSAYEWFSFGDTGLEDLLQQSAHMRDLVDSQIELRGALEGIPVIDTVRCMRELELPTDRMPTVDELKGTYRKLVKKCHPDLHPGNPEALGRFKAVQAAYDGVTVYYEQVEEASEQLAERLNAHFASHGATNGWKDGRATTGRQAASFPTDHLSGAQKDSLIQHLRDQGLAVEEGHAADIGGNVINVSGDFKSHSASAEIVEKLQGKCANTAVKSVPEALEAKNVAGKTVNAGASETTGAKSVESAAWAEKAAASSTRTKTAETLKDAMKPAEEAMAKAGGNGKWIVGGIIAASVAIGAYIMHKRTTAAEREQQRRQKDTTSPSIG